MLGLAQRHRQRRGDRLGDLLLDGEDVVQLAVERAGPELEAGAAVHQPRRDPQPVLGLAHAPLEQRADAQPPRDLAAVDRRAAEAERGAARGDAQPGDAPERGDDLLGHAVAEVLLVARLAEVLERQHGERRAARRGRRRPGAAQAVERVAQLHRGGEAAARVLVEAARDDGVELRRQRRAQRRGGLGVVAQDGGDDLRRGAAAERPLAGGHLVEHHAEREDVGAHVGRLPLDLLRRHVGDRAEQRPGADDRQRLRRALVDRRLRRAHGGDAEVDHLRPAVVGDDDVARLEVAVDDAVGVGRAERVGERHGEVEQRADRQAGLGDHRVERAAADELHHQQPPAVGVLDAVQADDVRVVERGEGARLALQPRQRLGGGGDAVGEELHRDVAAELRVAGAPDDPSAAFAEALLEAVVEQGVAGLDHRALPRRRRRGRRTDAGGRPRGRVAPRAPFGITFPPCSKASRRWTWPPGSARRW